MSEIVINNPSFVRGDDQSILDMATAIPWTHIRTSSSFFGWNNPINEQFGYGSNIGTAKKIKYINTAPNVDIVHVGDLPKPDCAEWRDANGVSRFRFKNWEDIPGNVEITPQEGGVIEQWVQDQYLDFSISDHATVSLSTMAGAKYGVAKSARLYAIVWDAVGGWEGAMSKVQMWHQWKREQGINRGTVVHFGTVTVKRIQEINSIYAAQSGSLGNVVHTVGMPYTELVDTLTSVAHAAAHKAGSLSGSLTMPAYDRNAAYSGYINSGVYISWPVGNSSSMMASPSSPAWNDRITMHTPSAAGRPVYQTFFPTRWTFSSYMSVPCTGSIAWWFDSGREQLAFWSPRGSRVDFLTPSEFALCVGTSGFTTHPDGDAVTTMNGTSHSQAFQAGIAATYLDYGHEELGLDIMDSSWVTDLLRADAETISQFKGVDFTVDSWAYDGKVNEACMGMTPRCLKSRLIEVEL